ncbi:MAG: nucleoside-diphosphate sugar epimerase/dehydratase [Candidatus Marinimicrobia bacterium]|jgi:FlaA1/EpsC-like NDP-sugar epimerase|nr:nucleoside-diphosphate sugar epimerase/dehydratase [Candidatus Neomarinimicrobiota bacterium]|tara:strand:+ start:64 stop:1971 length:1908 start_codon:yes stop_codon:yes gene_type:complete
MNKTIQKSRNVVQFLLVDIFLILGALYIAFLLRFDFSIPAYISNNLFTYIPVVLTAKLISFSIFGMYRGMWRYTSISDIINIVRASSLGSLMALSILALLFGLSGFPRSVLFIDYALCTIFLGASRASVRLYFSNLAQTQNIFSQNALLKGRKKLIMIGGGDSAEKIVREIRDNTGLKYVVVGIVDDNTSKIGATIHGIPILGPIDELANLKIPFDEIIICIPTASNIAMRRIVAICKATGKSYRTVPTFMELIDGKVSMKSVRDVSMVDLLGRKEVELDRSSISHYIYGKRVLVTGAGGSIGAELVRNCLTFDPDLLVLLDQSEHNLFNIGRECEHSKHPVSFQPVLGDIRDKTLLYRVFSSFKPDVVFHAAAYKHVPMQEDHPWEAILTNIQGTLNLIDVSEEHEINRFVLVSTDKAVNPTNIMGATKRVAEKLIQSKSIDSNVKYMAVRFGNVIGSSGSVIPTFQKQIRNGGPVTITDANMHRYFMSISEAALLILQAGAMGTGGEIYVLDMGKPVNIKDVAYELIRLSGLEPETDIGIEYIGMRPGEKMFEELQTQDENINDTNHEKILVLKNGNGYNWDNLLDHVGKIVSSARSYDYGEVTRELKNFIPEYVPDSKTVQQRLKTTLIDGS